MANIQDGIHSAHDWMFCNELTLNPENTEFTLY